MEKNSTTAQLLFDDPDSGIAELIMDFSSYDVHGKTMLCLSPLHG